MADLDNQTLFGEKTEANLTLWPVCYGSIPPLKELTLFGEPALWRTVPWPEGYGSA